MCFFQRLFGFVIHIYLIKKALKNLCEQIFRFSSGKSGARKRKKKREERELGEKERSGEIE